MMRFPFFPTLSNEEEIERLRKQKSSQTREEQTLASHKKNIKKRQKTTDTTLSMNMFLGIQ